MEIADWFVTYRRAITVKEMRPLVTKYFPTEKEFIEFLEYLKTPEGTNEFRRELRDAMRREHISLPPEEEYIVSVHKAATEQYSTTAQTTNPRYLRITDSGDSTFTRDFPVSEEAFDRENQRLKSAALRPAKGIFLEGLIKDEGGNGHEPDLELPDTTTPEEGIYRAGDVFKVVRGEAILDFYARADRKWVVTYEPEGKRVRLDVITMDKMVDSGEWVYQPKEVEELTPATIDLLAATEGDPLRKFCCRQCGECAPKEFLEEGKFPERIAWLRSHYKVKHPSMWGKVAVTPVTPEVIRGFKQFIPAIKTAEGILSQYPTEDIKVFGSTQIFKRAPLTERQARTFLRVAKAKPDLDIVVHNPEIEVFLKEREHQIDFKQPETYQYISFKGFPAKYDGLIDIKGDTVFRAGENFYRFTSSGFQWITDPNLIKSLKEATPINEVIASFKRQAFPAIPELQRELSSAVIPTEPSPPSPKQELEFVSDSPEYLAFTIDDIGYREKLDTAFETAIARAKGG